MAIGSLRNNISALQIISQLYHTNDRLETNLQHISSGLRLTSAKDDPGGFILSNQLRTQFRGLSNASENTQVTSNLVATTLSATEQIISILNDIRSAAVSASGGSATQQTIIQDKLEELNRIASTTRFNDKYLLNGSLAAWVGFKSGTRDFGASLTFGPDATSLLSGRSYLNIGVSNNGTAQIQNGGDGTYNTGLTPQIDVAVTTAQIINAGSPAGSGTTLSSSTANRVAFNNTDVITFNGILVNGTTVFSGSLTVTGTNTVQDLMDAVQSSIDKAETHIGVDGTGTLETTVSVDGNGRLQFTSGSSKSISQFSIDFGIQDTSDTVKTTFSITHDSTVYNSENLITATGTQIGNNYTAITGSTFDSGTFTISISNIVAAQQRQMETSTQFDQALGGPAVNTGATAIAGSFINSLSISDGDTIEILGTDPDGGTFTTTYTVGIDGGVGDGLVTTFQDLVDELNNRDRSLTSMGFNGAVATLTGAGTIQLYDDVADSSFTDLQININSVTSSVETINSTINQGGSREMATISIDGGTAQEVYAGQVVTLKGVNLSGGPVPELTLRMGRGFTTGSDQLQTTAKTFIGTLNGGTAVTFQNGDQSVRFTAGEASIYPSKKYQQVTLDFDAITNITAPYSSGGETFVFSTTSNAANFQIGSDRGDIKQYLFADLRSQNLGTDAVNNLDRIDVTTATGATDALDIIDDALDQVNRFAGRLGSFSSSLDDTLSVLNNTGMNIETAYNQIVSADIAKEVTDMTLNTVLLQAESAVLVQANTLPQALMKILFDLP